EVARGKTVSEAEAAGHVDQRYAEQPGLRLNAFVAHVPETGFVNGGRREGVSLIELVRVQNEVAGRCKCRPDGRAPGIQHGPVDIAVDAVLAEILIDADIELRPISEVGAVEDARVQHRRIA